MSFLIDTCVISELLKKECDAQVEQWFETHDEGQMYLSIVTRNIKDMEPAGVEVLNPWNH